MAEMMLKQVQYGLNPQHITLRHFIRWLRRAQNTMEKHRAGRWEDVFRRHALILFPKMFEASDQPDNASVTQDGDNVVFSMHGLECRTRGNLRQAPQFCHGSQPPAAFVRTIVRVAFALLQPRPEPLLLVGPTSHKSLAVEALARIMAPTGTAPGELPAGLSPVFLSQIGRAHV